MTDPTADDELFGRIDDAPPAPCGWCGALTTTAIVAVWAELRQPLAWACPGCITPFLTAYSMHVDMPLDTIDPALHDWYRAVERSFWVPRFWAAIKEWEVTTGVRVESAEQAKAIARLRVLGPGPPDDR